MIGRWGQLPLIACFALVGMYWAPLADIGPFSIEAFHAGFLIVIILAGCTKQGLVGISSVYAQNIHWLTAYIAYLLLLLPAGLGTPGFGIWVVQVYFVAGFLAIAGWCSRVREPQLSLRAGALLGLFMFLLLTEVSARSVGLSLPSAVMQFLISGNHNELIYGFFRTTFNALSSNGEAVSDAAQLKLRATVTNSIAAAILVLAIICRAGCRRSNDLVGSGIVLFALVMSILLDARSVLLGGVLCVATVVGLRMLVSQGWTQKQALGAVLLTTGGLALAAIGLSDRENALDTLYSSYSFQDASSESRLMQYRWALALIDDKIISGHGYIENEQSYPIHNLFLSSWAYVGLFGFLSILVFYFGLVLAWLSHLTRLVRDPHHWMLDVSAEWIAVLPILPLFRMWISGGGGHMSVGEWLALAVYFGLIARNELRRRTRGNQPFALIEPRGKFRVVARV